ncbi:hypothetical protein GGP53_003279 [Salinibacter ruber]|nr:hypothetical protein [Salinibacter ruber]MCS4119646.1 hypothetical protein [Salinibacter ruber]MCS4146306.1 hypothetical protein [Salinibacter ruber]
MYRLRGVGRIGVDNWKENFKSSLEPAVGTDIRPSSLRSEEFISRSHQGGLRK